jgi:putative AlgH/UPF0301 family transcriptional regulator
MEPKSEPTEESESIRTIQVPKEHARDLSLSYRELQRLQYEEEKFGDDATELYSRKPDPRRPPPHMILFRALLKDVVAGPLENDVTTISTATMMNFPSHISSKDTDRLKDVIRREFRGGELSKSSRFTENIQREVAFLALKELNRKMAYAMTGEVPLEDDKVVIQEQRRRNQRQAAKNVEPLNPLIPSAFFQPCTYLVAHPLMTGYFARSVICILDHTDAKDDPDTNEFGTGGGTYGLVINKMGVGPTGRDRMLSQVIRADSVPEKLRDAFGDCSVREGGPVNVSLQMIHVATPDQDIEHGIGGNVLSSIPPTNTSSATTENDDDDIPASTAIESDAAIYFRGDVLKGAQAVLDRNMDRDSFSFWVGASCWEAGQLESEIQRGFWLPCRGPPDICFTGMCEHNTDDINNRIHNNDDKDTGKLVTGIVAGTKQSDRPRADLWLSMMSANGNDNATLAHLLLKEEYHEDTEACDDF